MKKVLSILCVALLIFATASIAVINAAATDISSYTYEGKQPIASNDGDAEMTKLTDGVKAQAASLWDEDWVIFESKDGNVSNDILFDLGKAVSIEKVSLNFLIDKDNGVSYPVTFKISIGESKDNLTEIASEAFEWLDEISIEAYEKSFDAASARFIKLSFTGTDYSWNTYYGIDEVVVQAAKENETPVTKPEEPITEPKPEEPNPDTTPKTGDNAFIYITLMLLPLIATVIYVKKRIH